MIRLTEASIDLISRQAVAEYPSECCGIVTGNDCLQRVHPCRNRQDELHAADPVSNPRTSREAYDIDRKEMDQILADAAAKAERIICFYHSHIDCSAYFSRTDRDAQTVFGEPEFPEALHAVVSVQGRRVIEINGYLWDGEKNDFETIRIMGPA